MELWYVKNVCGPFSHISYVCCQDDEAELLAELERIKAERAEEAARVAAERAAEEEKKVTPSAASSDCLLDAWKRRMAVLLLTSSADVHLVL